MWGLNSTILRLEYLIELIVSLSLDLVGQCQRIKERGRRSKGGVGTKAEGSRENIEANKQYVINRLEAVGPKS